MTQTRFYIVENSKSVVRVNLFVGGLPPQLSAEEYTNILKDDLAIKSKSNSVIFGLQILDFTVYSYV